MPDFDDDGDEGAPMPTFGVPAAGGSPTPAAAVGGAAGAAAAGAGAGAAGAASGNLFQMAGMTRVVCLDHRQLSVVVMFVVDCLCSHCHRGGRTPTSKLW
jgi:hypothetical protein